ncbi:MAG: hypothetical protein KDA25_08460, partial [Phycisphaerales bacterium]|nr:hypothetical protein [Phycisphaerales bacterium]
MTDARRRSPVDRPAHGHRFDAHRILRAVTMALQPPRLVIGLLMVTALVTAGRVWDAATTPTYTPRGVLGGAWTVDDQVVLERVQRDAILSRIDDPAARPPGEPDTWLLRPDETIDRLEAHVRARRASAPDVEDIAAEDAAYLATVARIRAAMPQGSFASTSRHVIERLHRITQGVLFLHVDDVFEATTDLFVRLPRALWRTTPMFAAVYGLIALLILAIGGGALSRMAACDFAGQERLRVRQAIDFAAGAAMRLALAPILPLVFAGLLVLLITLLGLLTTVPWLNVIGGILYGFALVLGFLATFLLLLYATGFVLLGPAVACENCDPIDALQRSYAYVLRRPLHLVAYGIVAIIGLAVGYVIVSLFAVVTLDLTALAFERLTQTRALAGAGGVRLWDLGGVDATPLPTSTSETATAFFIDFWQTVVVCLVAAYVFAYFF